MENTIEQATPETSEIEALKAQIAKLKAKNELLEKSGKGKLTTLATDFLSAARAAHIACGGADSPICATPDACSVLAELISPTRSLTR